MKSSTGQYYVGLDHIRAIAALMVFTWHFIHVNGGNFSPPPHFPLSLLMEGHTGVALFMTLSGYLFAKLLAGKKIVFTAFIWNRILRLAPLLILVFSIVGVRYYLAGANPFDYAKLILSGFILPSWPNGGWSIAVEFHFYLLLPLLLVLSRKANYVAFFSSLIVGMIILRVFLYQELGQIHNLSYLTIIGRLDQFVLGILAYQLRHLFRKRHVVALAIFFCFAAFWWYFDYLGGYYSNSRFPHISRNPIWIYLPTVEGMAYASLIAWYDNSFSHSSGRISRFVALIGTYSYSIYLLHYFFVFHIANAIDKHVVSLSNLYLAMLLSPIAFLLIVPFSWASYRYIESPFLKFRTKYIVERTVTGCSNQASQ